jgi:hypothetical protein
MGKAFPYRVVVPGPVPVTKSDVTRWIGCKLAPIPDVALAAFFPLFVKGLQLEYFWNGVGEPWNVDCTELRLRIITCVPDRDTGKPVELCGSELIYAAEFDAGRPVEQWIEQVIVAFVNHEALEGIQINGSRCTELHPDLTGPSREADATTSTDSASR